MGEKYKDKKILLRERVCCMRCRNNRQMRKTLIFLHCIKKEMTEAMNAFTCYYLSNRNIGNYMQIKKSIHC